MAHWAHRESEREIRTRGNAQPTTHELGTRSYRVDAVALDVVQEVHDHDRGDDVANVLCIGHRLRVQCASERKDDARRKKTEGKQNYLEGYSYDLAALEGWPSAVAAVDGRVDLDREQGLARVRVERHQHARHHALGDRNGVAARRVACGAGQHEHGQVHATTRQPDCDYQQR